MKITKSGETIDILKARKSNANIGCEVCPNCGEVSIFHGGLCKTWAEGLFKMKSMKIDCYSCMECGCQWESEPYEYA